MWNARECFVSFESAGTVHDRRSRRVQTALPPSFTRSGLPLYPIGPPYSYQWPMVSMMTVIYTRMADTARLEPAGTVEHCVGLPTYGCAFNRRRRPSATVGDGRRRVCAARQRLERPPPFFLISSTRPGTSWRGYQTAGCRCRASPGPPCDRHDQALVLSTS